MKWECYIISDIRKNAFAQPFLRLCEILFIYRILSLCRFIFLHFCGAWVYQQSDPLWNATGGQAYILLIIP